jgi:methionyl-tRNA formyltransferase
MPNIKFAFLGATNYSKELLLFLIEKSFIPSVIFAIPKEFSISYSEEKVKNTNYANLEEIAKEYGIPYFEVDSTEGKRLKDYSTLIKEMNLDLLLVLGWYYMIPTTIRDLTKYGAWGIHASLLPKYAGGAPLVWAIINGEKESGVTLFRMEDGVDDGDIIAQERVAIAYEDTIKEVYENATKKSKDILVTVFKNFDNLTFTKQDKERIEVFPQRSPEDGDIDWSSSALSIYNFIRAQTLPYPCAFSLINGNRLKIISSRVIDIENRNYQYGEVVLLDDRAVVATKDNFLEIELLNDGTEEYRFKNYANIHNLYGKIFETKKS